MHQLMSHTLAPSTHRQYDRCIKHYLEFCRRLNLHAFPLSEHNLMLHATHLSKHSSYSNIKTHLSAIKYFDIKHGYHKQLPPLPRLYMLIRSIKRTLGNSRKKIKRQPITILSLTKIHEKLLSSAYNQHDRQMIWSACTTAFFGFLRSSEYLAPTTKTFDANSTLLFQDITLSPSQIHISIKASKTDPFRNGCIVRLSTTQHQICPVTILKQYLNMHTNKSGPLFTFTDGSFLTRRRLNTFLKSVEFQDHRSPVSSHSFRIGAATTAAAAGIPSWLIKSLGRWNSNCFATYVRIPDSTIAKTSRLIVNTKKLGEVWDPDTAWITL